MTTSPSNIPAEAVEAARAAMLEMAIKGNVMQPNDIARAVLEAAVPHMLLSAAWHAAVSEAYVEGALSAEQANAMWAKNPYRRPE